MWGNNCIKYESNGDRNKTLSIEEYLNKIRPYLKKILNDLKRSDTCKIQLTIAINFISSKDKYEERAKHLESDDTEFMINDNANEVIEGLFQPLLSSCQIGLETLMKGNDFIFDCAHSLYYKFDQVNPNQDGSYIDFPDWIKKQESSNKSNQ